MKFLDKLFKRKKNSKRIYSDDVYFKSKLISINTEQNTYNLVMLFTFSDDYCSSAIEIATNNLTCKYISSSREIETEEDIIYMPENYLLIGGNLSQYIDTIKNINIANPFITDIINELYRLVDCNELSELINDGILKYSLFSDIDSKDLNKYVKSSERYKYTDISKIIKELPTEFTGDMILPFYSFYNLDNYKIHYTLNSYLNLLADNKIIDSIELNDDELKEIYNGILKNPTKYNLLQLVKPLYIRESLDLDTVNGELSSVELDELFKQEYDRFSEVYADSINYVNIDEVLSEDDPEYNNINEQGE